MNNAKIYYLCDRKKCGVCHYDTCHRTTDITHAVNFIKCEEGKYIEVPMKGNIFDELDSPYLAPDDLGGYV